MTNRIVTVLPATDQQRLHRELREMAKLIATDAPLTIERQFEPGEYVRVKGGLFDGHEGYVVKRHRKQHLIVRVTSFQGGISTELDDCRLEYIEREPIGLAIGPGGVKGKGTIEIGGR
jgi:transcription antitermination factor NusG